MLFWSWNLILVRGFESLFLLSNLFGVCVTSTTLKKCCRNVGKWDTFSGGSFPILSQSLLNDPRKFNQWQFSQQKKQQQFQKYLLYFVGHWFVELKSWRLLFMFEYEPPYQPMPAPPCRRPDHCDLRSSDLCGPLAAVQGHDQRPRFRA